MRPLPTGTVTFLFSDIEGSTRWRAGDERRPRRPGARLRGGLRAARRPCRADRARPPPAEGPNGAAAALPARCRGVSAPEDALPNEPARAADAARRPRGGAGRGAGTAVGVALTDADRRRRLRQDAARPAGSCGTRRRLQGRSLVGLARRSP